MGVKPPENHLNKLIWTSLHLNMMPMCPYSVRFFIKYYVYYQTSLLCNYKKKRL